MINIIIRPTVTIIIRIIIIITIIIKIIITIIINISMPANVTAITLNINNLIYENWLLISQHHYYTRIICLYTLADTDDDRSVFAVRLLKTMILLS